MPQAWICPVIVKKLEVAGVKPGVFAARAYPAPDLVDLQVPEVGDPVRASDRGGAGQRPAAGIGLDRDRDRGPLEEKSAWLSGSLFASTSWTASGEPVELNPVRMSEFTAVWAGCR